MLDAITLDQLRTFIAVADEGSFSAAGRKLKRVQSAVSHAMANLETQLEVRLWDRTRKLPALTKEGALLLKSARQICASVDELGRAAGALHEGLEPSLSLAVDAIMPVRALADLAREFAAKFPAVELRLHTETLSAVSALVLDGTCQIGVIGPAAHANGLVREHLATVKLLSVVGKGHPLAAERGRIPTQLLAAEVNIVLSERARERATEDQGVLSTRTWRVADLGTKLALIAGGLGWGNLPEHLVQADLKRGALVRIRPAAWSDDEWNLSLSVVHRADLVKGPATRFVLARLPQLCNRELGRRKL